jgi:hypothetical protein
VRCTARLVAVCTAGLITATNASAHPHVEAPTSVVGRVRAGGQVALYERRGGRPLGVVGAVTEFGSPMTFGIVRSRGAWLAVRSSQLGNDQVGWIRRSAVSLSTLPTTIDITLSRRELVVRRHGRIVKRMVVGIGSPSTPTPVGVFAVTDELSGPRFGAAYGCCIVALSAHQPRLPAGWRGGDRIAIHGTNEQWTIGRAASAGCLHAGEADLRVLMRTVPLGTRVTIRP